MVASRYLDGRERVVGAVALLTDEQRAVTVPACPEWTVHDLLAHMVSMPMAILAGDVPESVVAGGDPNPWLADLVAEHSARSFADLARWWASEDDALVALLPDADLLLTDLVTHEGDLHGALGSRAHRGAPELADHVDAALAGLRPGLDAAGLAPIAVDTGAVRRVSGEGEPGWTLRTGLWEAHRALSSRRTRAEVLALPHEGDPTAYVEVLDRHLPLPARSLGEGP